MSDVTTEEKINGLQNICDYLEDAQAEIRFLGDEYEEEYAMLDSILNDLEEELNSLRDSLES